jgi:predicted aspartyl protease
MAFFSMIILVETPNTTPDAPLEIEIDESRTVGFVIAVISSLTSPPPKSVDLLLPGTHEFLDHDTVISSFDLGKIDVFQAVFSRNNAPLLSDFVDYAEQRRILEHIQRECIEENRQYAHDHAPESLVDYSVLLLDLTINNHTVRVIVDTGAQMSLLPMSCVQQCNVHYLIDRRCRMTVEGVGTQQSIGKIHALAVNVAGCVFTNPFVVIDEPLQTPLLGVDWLMKNRAIIDLSSGNGCLGLQGGAVRVPFVVEDDQTY